MSEDNGVDCYLVIASSTSLTSDKLHGEVLRTGSVIAKPTIGVVYQPAIHGFYVGLFLEVQRALELQP